jgi:hypothetical protein
MSEKTDTPTRKPNRRKRVDEHPAVQEWMKGFIANTHQDLGVQMTMDQASDAFVKWAFSGTKPGEDGSE